MGVFHYLRQKIMRIMIGFFLLITLASCSVYHLDVEQGNIVTADMVKQLNVGMTKQQVAASLGSPVLDNVLNANCWYYVYTFQKGGHRNMIHKNLVICFNQNDRVTTINNDYPTHP